MKAVLMSIQPYWVFLIIAKKMGWNIDKDKTVEVRKSRPKAESWNKVTKIYCSKDKRSFAKIPKEYRPFMKQLLGKVIGEFVCEDITDIHYHEAEGGYSVAMSHPLCDFFAEKTCLKYKELHKYLQGNNGYGWHISNLVIYDDPKELSEFSRHDNSYDNAFGWAFGDRAQSVSITRPPQSWCYVHKRSGNNEKP